MNPVLFGAEKMLVAMGYQPVPGREAEVLSLAPAAVGQHPVNIDMVTSVARDCLLAGVECRLLADVHAAVSAQFPTTTAEEVIEFRRDHIGSTEVCSRELLYRKQQLAALPSPQYRLQSCGFPGSEGRPSGDRDKERDRDRDKECGENGARPRELDSESMDTSGPATEKIVTNNYDMPIITESPQLSTSLSPELEPMDTSDPAESLPHKFVSEETDSTTNNVISIPDTDDMANIEIISKGQLLLDSMEFPERKCRKVAMEQRRQRQIRDQQSLSNLPLFPDAWTEENNRALKTSRKRAFGEDLGWSGGGGAAVPPLLELQGVPHPPQRRQLLQLPHPHRQVEIPLDIHHKMQDPRREDTQQLPEILYLYE